MPPYVGEIRMFAGNFAPAGWMFCEGQLLPISENETLFNLIGTTYGGDGQPNGTFALPDLRGRVPIHMGQGSGLQSRQFAEAGGVETVTLTVQQIPQHTHPLLGSTATASSAATSGNVGARSTVAAVFPYGTDAPLQPLSPSAVVGAGGSLPHENCQPFLCINFIVSLFGVFPSAT